MNKQVSLFFLEALSDHLQGKTTEIPVGLDRAELCTLARQQKCESILYCQTHLAELKNSFLADTYCAVNRKALLKSIHDSFATNNIPYLIFKGSEAAQHYPRPELRSMGDVDLLVHECDKQRTSEALQKLGFTAGYVKDTDHEWTFSKGMFEIELHHRLLYNEDLNEDIHISFTDKVWEHVFTSDSIQYHLETEFHFVYLILHLRKHLLWSGIGIRQFMDLAAMMKNAPINWDSVERYLKRVKLLPFARVCFAFVQRWFGITCQISPSDITDEFYEATTSTVLSDGVFGRFDRMAMTDNAVVYENRKHGKLLAALRVIFPPFEKMKLKYPQMAVSSLLLPIMWIRRIVDSVIEKKAGKALTFTGKHLFGDNSINDKIYFFQQWGL